MNTTEPIAFSLGKTTYTIPAAITQARPEDDLNFLHVQAREHAHALGDQIADLEATLDTARIDKVIADTVVAKLSVLLEEVQRIRARRVEEAAAPPIHEEAVPAPVARVVRSGRLRGISMAMVFALLLAAVAVLGFGEWGENANHWIKQQIAMKSHKKDGDSILRK
ncbi:hypothetical protein [Paraburkholderia sp. Ac-20347]|uniref:hypothetical protein n=1 Tax=Paraburkholderia sp. Ac-20347 TaxID=2703892 RepID=UPI00197DC2CC|nr:hypothetical protein [Paraburkholderia sp. Ac-20347]MBN3813731.1 hypothetical protein [Paraburkholderia sp. Ac-20347]